MGLPPVDKRAAALAATQKRVLSVFSRKLDLGNLLPFLQIINKQIVLLKIPGKLLLTKNMLAALKNKAVELGAIGVDHPLKDDINATLSQIQFIIDNSLKEVAALKVLSNPKNNPLLILGQLKKINSGEVLLLMTEPAELADILTKLEGIDEAIPQAKEIKDLIAQIKAKLNLLPAETAKPIIAPPPSPQPLTKAAWQPKAPGQETVDYLTTLEENLSRLGVTFKEIRDYFDLFEGTEVPWGKDLFEVTLSDNQDQVFDGVLCARGSTMVIDETGRLLMAKLAADGVLDGLPCKKGLIKRTADGRLNEFVLGAKRTFDSPVGKFECDEDDRVTLALSGSLDEVIISQPRLFADMTLPAGTKIVFFRDSSSITLSQELVIGKITFPKHQELIITDDAITADSKGNIMLNDKPQKDGRQLLLKKLKLREISLPIGVTIHFDENENYAYAEVYGKEVTAAIAGDKVHLKPKSTVIYYPSGDFCMLTNKKGETMLFTPGGAHFATYILGEWEIPPVRHANNFPVPPAYNEISFRVSLLREILDALAKMAKIDKAVKKDNKANIASQLDAAKELQLLLTQIIRDFTNHNYWLTRSRHELERIQLGFFRYWLLQRPGDFVTGLWHRLFKPKAKQPA